MTLSTHTLTEDEIDAQLGPPSAERDCEIQGWMGALAHAFKEGWDIGYRAGLRATAKDKQE